MHVLLVAVTQGKSPGDEAKLDNLEFIPGDRGIEKLDPRGLAG
jgi:hypothetical protein